MNPVLAIAGVELRRFFRDRSNIFFVFIFPLMLILLLGIQFGVGSAGPIVAVAGGEGTPLAVERLNGVKYASANDEALRLAIEQQQRGDHLAEFIEDYEIRYQEAAAAEQAAVAERDRLFDAGEQDAGREMSEVASAHGKRKSTFDPAQLRKA